MHDIVHWLILQNYDAPYMMPSKNKVYYGLRMLNNIGKSAIYPDQLVITMIVCKDQVIRSVFFIESGWNLFYQI